MDPRDVLSPRRRWSLHRVLHNGSEWSAAEGEWKDGDGVWRNRLAIRWNGHSDEDRGNPRSHGYATWFIVPPDLEPVIRAEIATYALAPET